ncbi:MAG: hypothetical protein WA254_08150 [Candidatus Sulfotelmatobacter sp.]
MAVPRQGWVMRYSLLMTPRFKRIVEAAGWFVVGFVTHMLLLHFHHHPG